MHNACIAQVADSVESKLNELSSALQWLGWTDIKPGTKIFIKPNLTWSEPMPGVTTTSETIEAVGAYFSRAGAKVIVGESDGGYHTFGAEEAFLGHKLYQIAERYGARVVNLSRLPTEVVTILVDSRQVSIELPSLLVHEIDIQGMFRAPSGRCLSPRSLCRFLRSSPPPAMAGSGQQYPNRASGV